MRHIGSLPNHAQAQLFEDFLVSQGIRTEIEPEADGLCLLWVRDEDQIAAAEAWLAKFKADPNAAEFHAAIDKAAEVRKAEAEDLERYRRRIHTRRSLFPKFGGYGVGVLTYALVMGCLVVAALSGTVLPGQEENRALVRSLCISDPELSNSQFLPEVFAGEVWRLFTPIFLHSGLPHILFNVLALLQLGCMIEARRSTGFLALFVAVSAIGSNVAQYYFVGPWFGGMSGVVYALGGYIWIKGKYDRASGLFLDPQSVTFMLVWLVVCFTGWAGPIANTAHVAGLIVGAAWGGISAYFARRKPE